MDRSAIVHENFLRRLSEVDLPPGRAPVGPLSQAEAVSIYRSGCLCRALDRKSRAMQAAGQGYYTIGSSGHEGMAAVAAALPSAPLAAAAAAAARCARGRGGSRRRARRPGAVLPTRA